MANHFETDEDDLTDDEIDEQFIRDAMDALPDRIEIHGQRFMRSGSPPIYTNIEDVDDDCISEIDPETGELCQWPDCE